MMVAACAAPVEAGGAGESTATQSAAVIVKAGTSKPPLHTTDDPSDPPPSPPPPGPCDSVAGWVAGAVVAAPYNQCPTRASTTGELIAGVLGPDFFSLSVMTPEERSTYFSHISADESAVMSSGPFCVYDDARVYDEMKAEASTETFAPLCQGRGTIGGGSAACVGCRPPPM
jgi:hypothetical protein